MISEYGRGRDWATEGTEKCIKIFQSYDQKCTATFLVNHSVQSLLSSSHVGGVLLSQPFVCLFVCCEQKKNFKKLRMDFREI